MLLFVLTALACRPADTASSPEPDSATQATAATSDDTASSSTDSADGADSSADTADGDTGAASDTGPMGLLLDAVTYHLTWDLDRVEQLDGGGWRVVNDRGDTVEIDDGFLVTYELHLEPCRSARHSGDDPSAISAPWIERLVTLEDQALEPVAFEAGRYCGAYYGVARSDWSARNAPDDLTSDSISLYLRGRWWPEGGEPAAFEWSSASSNGWADDLSLDSGTATDVTASRSPGALFDGVDLSGDPDVILRDVIENLVLSLTFTAF